MVYVDSYNIGKAFDTNGLTVKYPVIKSNLPIFSSIFTNNFARYNPYQRLGRRFIRIMTKYVVKSKAPNLVITNTLPSIDEYIEQECVRDLSCFGIYHKHILNDFYATKYVTEFFGKTIDEILTIFAYCNMKTEISGYLCHHNPELNIKMNNIFDMHLVMALAETFALFDLAIKHGLVNPIFNNIYTTFIINNKITKCLTKNTTMQKYIDDPNSKLMAKIRVLVSNNEINHLKIGVDSAIQNLVNEIYEMQKTIFCFFRNKNSPEMKEFCEKNPNLNVMVGRYFNAKRNLTDAAILKFIFKFDKIYLYHVINSMDVDINFEQICDLKIPQNKPINKMLVIDV